MDPNQPSKENNLPSLNDMISPEKEVDPAKIGNVVNQQPEQINFVENEETKINPNPTSTQVQSETVVKEDEAPTVVKITKKTVTTSQPVTQTIISRKIVTTTNKGPETKKYVQNTRYGTNPSTNTPKTTQIKTTTINNYTRPNVKPPITLSNNRNNNSSINTNNKVYKNYNRNNQPTSIQGTKSYSGNRDQPKRPEVSSSHYKARPNSPNPPSIKMKTIIRGKPIENIQITHIICSSRPLEFHITEQLNLDNLNSGPIQIADRNNLQKSGKVEVSCSCDNVSIKKQEPANLTGKLIHYQHAQGIGMTDDTRKDINPKFYNSEIKTLEPIITKTEPNVEYLEFRSAGKTYTTTKTVNKTITKPTINYTINKSGSKYTQNRTYNNYTQPKISTNYSNNRGAGSAVKTSTSTSSYRGNTGSGDNNYIVKETTTKVQMGRRSQFQNPTQPVITVSTEKKVYNQNNFFKK